MQMPYQWLYNPIIEISTNEYIIEMLRNVIKTVKMPLTITVNVCYQELVMFREESVWHSVGLYKMIA